MVSTLGAPERRWLRGRRPRPASPAPAPVDHRARHAGHRAALRRPGRGRALAARGGRGRGAGGGGHPEPRAAHAARRHRRSARARGAPRAGGRRARRATARAIRWPTGAGSRRSSSRFVAPRTRREAALRPQERLGALLGGRDAVLACEELALRARQDVDAGRRREAALQLDAALTAGLAELEPWSSRGDLAERLAELRDLQASRPGRRPGRAAGRRRGRGRRRGHGTACSAWRPRCGRARRSGSTDRPSAGGRSGRSGGCAPPVTGVGSPAPDIEG